MLTFLSRRPSRFGAAAGLVMVPLVLGACSGGSDGGTGDALADGNVTAAEYRQAVEAEMECVHKAGYHTTDIREAIDPLLLSFNIRLSSGAQEVLDKANAAQDSCYDKHAKAAEKAYFEEHIPTGAQRDRMFDDLIDCLKDEGVTGVTHSDDEQHIVKKIATQRADDMSGGLFCIEKYELVFPEGRFPG